MRTLSAFGLHRLFQKVKRSWYKLHYHVSNSNQMHESSEVCCPQNPPICGVYAVFFLYTGQLCHRVQLAFYFTMFTPSATSRRKLLSVWAFSYWRVRQRLCQQANRTTEQNGDSAKANEQIKSCVCSSSHNTALNAAAYKTIFSFFLKVLYMSNFQFLFFIPHALWDLLHVMGRG